MPDAEALQRLRREYLSEPLDDRQVAADPVTQFRAWMEEAISAEVPDANAMVLATAGSDGAPTSRIVLLKDYGPDGFVFYTNFESDKARDLETNPRASLLFYWSPLNRQVRIRGHATRVADAEADAYFAARPREAQLGALASRQSHVIPDRAALESAYEQVSEELAGADVPRPGGWGGYRVVPDAVEFWQGRPSRLHDRIRYRRGDDGDWVIERLAP